MRSCLSITRVPSRSRIVMRWSYMKRLSAETLWLLTLTRYCKEASHGWSLSDPAIVLLNACLRSSTLEWYFHSILYATDSCDTLVILHTQLHRQASVSVHLSSPMQCQWNIALWFHSGRHPKYLIIESSCILLLLVEFSILSCDWSKICKHYNCWLNYKIR